MKSKFVYINYRTKMRQTDNPELEYRTNGHRIATKRTMHPKVDQEKLVKLRRAVERAWYLQYTADQYVKYDVWEIPKRSGGTRTIKSPATIGLRTAQADFLAAVEKAKWVPSNNAHGFVKDRNCKSALQVHQKHHSRWFLKMDIKSFFDTTTAAMVRDALDYVFPFNQLSDSEKNTLITITTYENTVPQGALTSPFICNMVLVPFDYALQKYCHEHSLIYTRYADDLLISSEVKFDWQEVQEEVQKLLAMLGYQINTEKTRFGSFNGRNWNLGIMYNNKFDLTIGYRQHHILKCRVHNFCTAEIKTKDEYYQLIGLLGYWKYIEPENPKPQTLIAELQQYKDLI